MMRSARTCCIVLVFHVNFNQCYKCFVYVFYSYLLNNDNTVIKQAEWSPKSNRRPWNRKTPFNKNLESVQQFPKRLKTNLTQLKTLHWCSLLWHKSKCLLGTKQPSPFVQYTPYKSNNNNNNNLI